MALQQANVLSFPSSIRPSTKEKARKTKFTQTKLEALRHHGGSPEYVYDRDKPGLAVRLTSGGARTFVFVGRLHGTVTRITLGRVEALPLNKARSAIDKIRGDVALGLDVVAQRKSLRRVEAARTTLDQAFGQFPQLGASRHRFGFLRRTIPADHPHDGRCFTRDVDADRQHRCHCRDRQHDTLWEPRRSSDEEHSQRGTALAGGDRDQPHQR